MTGETPNTVNNLVYMTGETPNTVNNLRLHDWRNT